MPPRPDRSVAAGTEDRLPGFFCRPALPSVPGQSPPWSKGNWAADSESLGLPTIGNSSPGAASNGFHKILLPGNFTLALMPGISLVSAGMRVGLFIPCFIDQCYPQVGVAMVKVLRRLNIEVDFPAEQTCCGQPAFNTGYWEEARALARRYSEIFAGYDAIVSPSGSCTAMVRNYHPELLGKATPATTHTYEFAEFLVRKLGITDVGAVFPAKVTYHDSCHSLRELRLKAEPRQLLRNVKGLELVEMDASESCCGFGGTFSVKFPMISYAMDEVKVASIQRTGAEYVVSIDSSCLMQIDGYLRRKQVPVKTISLVEVLAST